jgi:hypothetical protein
MDCGLVSANLEGFSQKEHERCPGLRVDLRKLKGFCEKKYMNGLGLRVDFC